MASWGLWESTYFPSLDWPGFHQFFSPEAAKKEDQCRSGCQDLPSSLVMTLGSKAMRFTNLGCSAGNPWNHGTNKALPRLSPEMPQGAVDFFGSEVTMIYIYIYNYIYIIYIYIVYQQDHFTNFYPGTRWYKYPSKTSDPWILCCNKIQTFTGEMRVWKRGSFKQQVMFRFLSFCPSFPNLFLTWSHWSWSTMKRMGRKCVVTRSYPNVYEYYL